MEINPKIREVLNTFGIDEQDGIAYLLAIHFDCRPSYTPPILVQKINVTNILHFNGKELLWLVPLFEDISSDSITDEKWKWVNEVRDMFGTKNPARKGPKSAVLSRMKAYFSANPDVRKEDIIGAVQMYLYQVDSNYVTSTHYFITKGNGPTKVSLLEEWVEKYKAWEVTQQAPTTPSNDVTSQMQ